MFLWFVATAVIAVLWVFDSPAVDYRAVTLGALLPLLETVTGSPWLLHTLAGSVGLLTLTMVATTGRRILRRRLLGVPIGALLFLVASGSWTRTSLFWWPVAGAGTLGEGRPPELERPLGVIVALELAGLAGIAWLVRRFELSRPAHRRDLLRTGRLPRTHLG